MPLRTAMSTMAAPALLISACPSRTRAALFPDSRAATQLAELGMGMQLPPEALGIASRKCRDDAAVAQDGRLHVIPSRRLVKTCHLRMDVESPVTVQKGSFLPQR